MVVTIELTLELCLKPDTPFFRSYLENIVVCWSTCSEEDIKIFEKMQMRDTKVNDGCEEYFEKL